MFREGDLVFLDYEGGSMLRAPSRKLKRKLDRTFKGTPGIRQYTLYNI